MVSVGVERVAGSLAGYACPLARTHERASAQLLPFVALIRGQRRGQFQRYDGWGCVSCNYAVVGREADLFILTAYDGECGGHRGAFRPDSARFGVSFKRCCRFFSDEPIPAGGSFERVGELCGRLRADDAPRRGFLRDGVTSSPRMATLAAVVTTLGSMSDGLRVVDIAAKAGLTYGQVAGCLGRLTGRGVVKRQRGVHLFPWGRTSIYSLTDYGKAMLAWLEGK